MPWEQISQQELEALVLKHGPMSWCVPTEVGRAVRPQAQTGRALDADSAPAPVPRKPDGAAAASREELGQLSAWVFREIFNQQESAREAAEELVRRFAPNGQEGQVKHFRTIFRWVTETLFRFDRRRRVEAAHLSADLSIAFDSASFGRLKTLYTFVFGTVYRSAAPESETAFRLSREIVAGAVANGDANIDSKIEHFRRLYSKAASEGGSAFDQAVAWARREAQV